MSMIMIVILAMVELKIASVLEVDVSESQNGGYFDVSSHLWVINAS